MRSQTRAGPVVKNQIIKKKSVVRKGQSVGISPPKRAELAGGNWYTQGRKLSSNSSQQQNPYIRDESERKKPKQKKRVMRRA